jgi:hypothetical protein
MSCCLEVSNENAAGRTPCASCGAVGRAVSDQTIEAILTPPQAVWLQGVVRRFCGTPSCEVVYYGDDGRVVTKNELPIRVGVKENEDPIPLCYCFGFSVADVRREIAETGRSTLAARITAGVRAGNCACETRNPSGRCCLGEVNRTVRQLAENTALCGQPDR